MTGSITLHLIQNHGNILLVVLNEYIVQNQTMGLEEIAVGSEEFLAFLLPIPEIVFEEYLVHS